jgi:hypothetical protein
MKPLLLLALVCLPIASADAAKKKKPPASQNLVELVPDLVPQQPKDAEGKALPKEAEAPPEDAPYKGCIDAKGIAVLWREDRGIRDLAQALFDKQGRPTVEHNPSRMKYLNELTRTFFYAHECAHHALGHLYGAVQGVDKEQQADCWAVLTLKENGSLGEEGLETIKQDLGTVARADVNHSAGLRRASNLKWCLTEPLPQAKIAK